MDSVLNKTDQYTQRKRRMCVHVINCFQLQNNLEMFGQAGVLSHCGKNMACQDSNDVTHDYTIYIATYTYKKNRREKLTDRIKQKERQGERESTYVRQERLRSLT